MASSDTELSRRLEADAEDHALRCLKLARAEPTIAATTKVAPFVVFKPHALFPDGEQMLSFSSTTKEEAMTVTADGTLPYHHPSVSIATPYYRGNAGLYSGSITVDMHGVLARVRWPFTPSQWLELERQALIYKYILANVTVPPSLLFPIRRSLRHSGFPTFSAGSFGSSALGWGTYHQGYSGNDDPEPGRCRRTDGKKWRCSRDAVADQKYCERHMNRGRHRSRKHVEGHTGHAAKAIPAIAPSHSASSVSGGGISDNLTTSHHQTESLQTNITDCSPAQFDRMKMSKGNLNQCTQESEGLTMLGSFSSRPMNNLFPESKDHIAFEETASGGELGVISMESLMKPPSSSFSDNISSMTSPKINDQQNQLHHLRHFIDEWPKIRQDHSNISWSEVELQSDRTQLSISIPRDCSDFVSSSPNHDELIISVFKSSQEGYNTIDMDIAVGLPSEVSKCETDWKPSFWESSMAGPLGEVLNNTRSTIDGQCKNLPSLSVNFLTNGCDFNTWLESSPTGVLQKASFCSLSSGTRSNPRTDNHDGVLGSAL